MGMRFAVASLLLCVACGAHAQKWTVDNGASRLTADGPDLTRYQAGIMGVSECKLDVAFNVSNPEKRESFRRKCYELYDASIREKMIDVDNMVVPSKQKVEIRIRVEQNHFYIQPK